MSGFVSKMTVWTSAEDGTVIDRSLFVPDLHVKPAPLQDCSVRMSLYTVGVKSTLSFSMTSSNFISSDDSLGSGRGSFSKWNLLALSTRYLRFSEALSLSLE